MWRRHARVDAPRLALSHDLREPEFLIRELRAEDALALAGLAHEAQQYVWTWGDLLPVPDSIAEARVLLGQWEQLRAEDHGSVFGVFTADHQRLICAVAVQVDDSSAELAGWGTIDDRRRSVKALAYLVPYLADRLGRIRIWMDVSAPDQHAKTLLMQVGFLTEGTVTRPDGTTRERFSFTRHGSS